MKGKQVQQLIKYLIIISLLFFSSFLSALEVGDVVSNTATVEYAYHGASKRVVSNTTEHTIEQSSSLFYVCYPRWNPNSCIWK